MSGILRLESLTKGDTLKQGDKTPLKYRLFDVGGEKLSVAGKPAKVRLAHRDFLTIGYEKDGLTVAQDDTVTFTIDSIIPPSIYYVEIIVDDKFIFPSRPDESKFTVNKSSLGVEADIIQIIGKEEIARDVKARVEDDLEPFLGEIEQAEAKAEEAIAKANQADNLSKSVQSQFNQVVIDGDSSVESAQARVDASGHTNATLKERLDKEHNEVTEQLAQITYNVKSFGALGDSVKDDSDAIKSALEFVVSKNGTLSLEPNKTYVIKKNIVVDTYGMDNFEFNLNGSTLDFAEGGNLTFNVNNDVSYKETVLQTDLIKGATNFDVVDATGVEKGDLVIIKSPVVWVNGVTLEQTYTISDIEGNKIYVEGIVVGDISARQVQEAEVTGDIIVEFYKLSNGFKLKNGVITSKNRDSQSTMFFIKNQDNYLIEDVTVAQPNRSGIYVQKSGTGRIVDCYIKDHGYVTKDDGYNNTSNHPSGLAYGYGFIFARNYMTHVSGCHSFSGWHGFDVARGNTYAIFNDCTFHKDAFGISSHEGSWNMLVTNCKFYGGHAVTSRSAELIVMNCYMDCNMGRIIIGSGTHQKLFIKNNIIKTTGNALWLTGKYPEYCYSLEPPITEVSNNHVSGVTAESKIGYRGRATIKGNTIYSAKDSWGAFTMNSQSIKGHIIVSNNIFRMEHGQSAFRIDGSNEYVEFSNNSGEIISEQANCAFLFLADSSDNVVIDRNRNMVPDVRIVRNFSNTAHYKSIEGNVNYYSGIVLGGSSPNVTAEYIIGNTYKGTLINSTVDVEYEFNNHKINQ